MCRIICAIHGAFWSAPCAYHLANREEYEERWPDAEDSYDNFNWKWKTEELVVYSLHAAAYDCPVYSREGFLLREQFDHYLEERRMQAGQLRVERIS